MGAISLIYKGVTIVIFMFKFYASYNFMAYKLKNKNLKFSKSTVNVRKLPKNLAKIDTPRGNFAKKFIRSQHEAYCSDNKADHEK